MKKVFLSVIATIILTNIVTAQPYQTQIFNPNIKTLEIYNQNHRNEIPVLELNSDDKLIVSFDYMEFSKKTFYYKIVHCDKEFNRSMLSEMEYYEGFVSDIIYDVATSQNTINNYTNYKITLPNNENDKFKVSGNYVILISQNNDFDNPDASAQFYIVEQKIDISATIKSATNLGFNTHYQQLEIEIDNSHYPIQNPFADLRVDVMQNHRTDNAAIDIKPSFTSLYKQKYNNNNYLIFEGINQYRFIDFSDEYNYSGEIESIEITPSGSVVWVQTAYPRNESFSPSSYGNANGQYIINRRNYDNSNFEADYMWANFVLPNRLEYTNYNIFLLGDMLNNRLDSTSQMEYNPTLNIYQKSIFLKQGGCSFLYAFVPKDCKTIQECEASMMPFEGSYWQTNNEYTIFVYHDAFGQRYEKLIGVKKIKY
ncbi:MAG: hypothetical protein CSA89_01430 [Bacteroidales bacterium]|nr:MAG: hypothetical protein CSA89_01430 [Bacteroidales bacterium]